MYLSDIKKLATWYGIVSKHCPYQEPAATAEAATEPPRKPRTKPMEPLSTGGVIGAADEAPDAEGNPEAAAPAKKSRKKAE